MKKLVSNKKHGTIGAYTFLREAGTPAATVISRRGCRAACSFCSVRTVSGKGVRVRPGQTVAQEIKFLHKTYGVRHVMWLDDDLFFDIKAAITMFNEIADLDLPVTWDASNGVIAAAMTHALLEAAVASGCVGFNIGIESGNAEILRLMAKPGNLRTYMRAAELLTEFPSIFTKGFLLVGYPGENVGALSDTVDLAINMDLDWYPSQIVMPMGGTPIHQIMVEQDEYGETVLSAPTKFGFNLTAWVMPFMALIAGGVGIRKILYTWVGKKQPEDVQGKPEEKPAIPGKYSKRLQDELDGIEL